MEVWWTKMLKERYDDGWRDAELGVFEPPYPNSDDPQDQDENFEYEKGFHDKRVKLGKDFQWR